MRLHFAETWSQRLNSRRFDVLIEGERVPDLTDYEPLEAGFATAQEYPFDVEVTDGLLEVDFVSRIQDPKVSAIEIVRVE